MTFRREVRIGRPTITPEARRLLIEALDAGRVSEGQMTMRLEGKLAELLNAADAVAVNSGHSALYLALACARENYGIKTVVTTSLTFASTVSAALGAGLNVICVDVGNDFLLHPGQAAEAMEACSGKAAYLPVHLFGYPAAKMGGGVVQVQDACEALGTVRPEGGRPVGLPGFGCFSFYASHVAGCGEMGMVAVSWGGDGKFIRSFKDHGRRHLRPTYHVERMTEVPPGERYSHDLAGWNMKTTDLQAALAIGALESLNVITERRREVVKKLNRLLSPTAEERQFVLPIFDSGVSYLAYPIIAPSWGDKEKVVAAFEAAKIETRPLMSVIPLEKAFAGRVATPFGFENAKRLHRQGFYISCHDTMTDSDIEYIRKVFEEAV